MKTEKKYSGDVTLRFLQEMDRVVGSYGKVKITGKQFGESVGISSPMLTRLRKGGSNNVTVENCCRLIEKYGTDPTWLFTGKKMPGRVDTPAYTSMYGLIKME